MTVVGDFAQAGPVSTVGGWADALGARITVHTLTVNYRITAEILGTSRDLLVEIAPEQSPSHSLRHGEPPCTLTRAAVAAHLHPDQLTAMICADEDTARLAEDSVTARRWCRSPRCGASSSTRSSWSTRAGSRQPGRAGNATSTWR